MDITIKIIPAEANGPKDKLADAELLFGADCGILAGLRLIGFGVWERRGGGRHVTFPARTYSVNGERRSFALVRPRLDTAQALEETTAIRDAIIAAYAADEATR